MRKYCMEIPLWQSIVTISIFKLTLSTICSTIFIYLLTYCDTETKFLSRNNVTELVLDNKWNVSNNSESFEAEENDTDIITKGRNLKIIHTTYILLSILFITASAFSILLLVGAIRSSMLICKIWCGLTVFEIGFDTILIIVVLVIGGSSTVGILIGTCLISALFLGFVKNFMNEIATEEKEKSSPKDPIVDPGRESN